MIHFDETFWVGAAFVAFVFLAFSPLKKVVAGMLSSRAKRIRHELDEATRLKQEAQALVQMYSQKYQEAMQESENIIAKAQKEAEMMLVDARKQLDETIQRRLEQISERIAQAETNAIQEIQTHAIDIAVNATRALLKERLEKSSADEVLQLSLQEIERKLH